MSSSQLPLGLARHEPPGFAEFLPADSPAAAALRDWCLRGQADALLLTGARSTGKTHLLLAAAANLHAAGLAAVYLPLAGIAGQAAALVSAQPAVAALLVDDLQAAESDPALQRALFGLHNRQRDGGGRLLYASRQSPLEWPALLPDLRSRLNQCTRLSLPPLDESLRRRWLVERAQRRGFSLDEAAVEYVFRRVERDLHSLDGLLDRLDVASLAAQRRITLPFLRQVIRAGDSADDAD